jgi:hypothetical protein
VGAKKHVLYLCGWHQLVLAISRPWPWCFSFPTEKARGRETNGGDVTRHPGRPNRLVIFRGPAPHGRGGQSQNSRDIHHLRLPPQQRPSVPHPTAGARPCRAHVGWPVCFFLSLLRRAEQGHVHGRSTRSGSRVLGLWTPASLRPGRVERDGAAARGTLPRRAASLCTRGVVSFFWGGEKRVWLVVPRCRFGRRFLPAAPSLFPSPWVRSALIAFRRFGVYCHGRPWSLRANGTVKRLARNRTVRW